ncbi:MAG: tetratricopeptide repeat protein [Desulfuromonadales bacterium]
MKPLDRRNQPRRISAQTRPLLSVPALCGALLLSLAAGCAPTTPAPPEPAAVPTPVVEQQTIRHLDGGRTGFIITEIPNPATPWTREFDQAVAMLLEGRDREATPILEDIVAQSPEVTAPYINLALAYRHTGKLAQAEEQLQKALQLVPGHPVANNEYGLILRHAGRFQEARQVYESTVQEFPEYLPVRLNLGILCEIYLDDPACALEQYTAYSQAKPENESVALWIADLNLRMENP